MTTTTPEQLKKLPQWAQQHVESLQRQRDLAVRKLQAYTNTQTPSNVYTDDLLCLTNGAPTFGRHYFQTCKVTFEYGGVQLDVALQGERDNDPEIRLQWRSRSRLSDDVILQPKSFQHVVLKLPKGERTES